MSGLGIQNYPEHKAPAKKKNWIKLGLTAFMGLIVVALLASVASNTMNWLFVHPH
jgi:hypothetical protein